jgi:hypothetical protein
MYDLHTKTSADIYMGGSMWSPYYIYSKALPYNFHISFLHGELISDAGSQENVP